ncbi:alpha/beta hydrolase [Leptolyngbya sp. NK1-12]|uniref:Alpha/beta hydrolase n=1 Tax=Leptolyngbya sp. NK1-12 TaxID=2547451 RepID=A0AA96WWQ7_9CYAN|nr:C45 family autoproteolytic acyltransferase/hydolase [Leptolyngbya sp. NK1-12]WNZ25377.1 alpha/beta hydrolase [Leptolyngbya sp. NK1-12]
MIFLSLLTIFFRLTTRLRRSGIYLLIGLGLSLLFLIAPVHASTTVLLQSRDLKLPVSLTELQAFVADQDTSPALQQFWQDSEQKPADVKRWLTTEITAPEQFQAISSDFTLLQINKIVGDSLGREDLEPLRLAFAKTFKTDRSFSILEILQNYPRGEVRLEVSRLGQVYTDVNLLVTRIEPILKTAEALLPELVCDCNIAVNTTANTESNTESNTAAAPPNPAQAANAATRDAIRNRLPGNEATPSGTTPSLLAPLTNRLRPSTTPDLANKRLVIQFGPLGRSMSLQELTRFAQTGALPRGWQFFFNVAGVNPEAVRTALKQEVTVSPSFLDKTLNNLLGEFLLYQVGKYLHTPSKTANIQALRAASLFAANDNRLSLLEILQQYPTREVHLDGVRLARLGRNASRFQASGGVRGAVLSLEDWLVELQASAAENLCTCDPDSAAEVVLPPAPTISPDQIAQFLPPNWQPVAPHRQDYGVIKVVWLQGSPYEMGYQHGQYLHDEIASLGSDIIGALRFAGRGLALGRLSALRSYPEKVEECRGLADATQDIGMTMDACLVLAYGDVYQEIFASTLPDILFWDGCSQWVATGEATMDGRLYHGSTLDNDQKPINYIIYNPVVFIRQPNDGLPHVFITYPGVVWPNWGLNVAGITLGLDTVHPGPGELSMHGRSNVQILGQVLKTATSFAEARQIMETQPRVHADLVMITDGKSREAGVFEFTGRNLGVRELQENDVLYVTNHIVLEEMFDRQRFPISESSLTRFRRFSQLMEPDGISSLYGNLDPAGMVRIGRDRVNPDTLEVTPLEVFDDDASPGGNGSLRQGLYDPDKLLLWVAGGSPPVPENPFVCFSLGEMLNFPNSARCESPAL